MCAGLYLYFFAGRIRMHLRTSFHACTPEIQCPGPWSSSLGCGSSCSANSSSPAVRQLWYRQQHRPLGVRQSEEGCCRESRALRNRWALQKWPYLRGWSHSSTWCSAGVPRVRFRLHCSVYQGTTSFVQLARTTSRLIWCKTVMRWEPEVNEHPKRKWAELQKS